MEYQSLREKGSTVFFLRPFLPLDSLLFLSQVSLWLLSSMRIHMLTFQQP